MVKFKVSKNTFLVYTDVFLECSSVLGHCQWCSGLLLEQDKKSQITVKWIFSLHLMKEEIVSSMITTGTLH